MTLGDRLLGLAASHSEVIRDSLRAHGAAPLSDVLASLRAGDAPPLQDREDLFEAVGRHATASYGADVGRRAAAELRADPVVPTSNHFGIDTFADSVQGTLLFGLRPATGPDPRRTVVVLGGATVSMNNLTYPMGLQLYEPKGGDVAAMPQRLPVLPRRSRRSTVRAAGRFDEQMVGRATDRLRRMCRDGDVTPACAQAAERVLDEDFGSPEALRLETYGRQATLVNTRLWRRLFAGGEPPFDLVQLELEGVAGDLLVHDLRDPSTLASRVLFAPGPRDAVLAALDGATACWRLGGLARRLTDPSADAESRDGTVFFWALTEDGRRVPLTLVRDGTSPPRLAGTDERRGGREFAFTPAGVADAVEAGILVPSLFTCYVVLAFARGLTCVGGYYQMAYLPVMQRAVAEAIGREGGDDADRVAGVPTGRCLAGVQAFVRVLDDGSAIPAGPVELGAGDGLAAGDLRRALEVTVADAHLASFAETFRHMVPDAPLPEGWVGRLASENGAAGRRLVRLEGG